MKQQEVKREEVFRYLDNNPILKDIKDPKACYHKKGVCLGYYNTENVKEWICFCMGCRNFY